jgi:hypothetical protein
MPAVTAEIRAQCERLAIGVQFGGAQQAGIGQRHGGVLAAAHQGFQRRRPGLKLQPEPLCLAERLVLSKAVFPELLIGALRMPDVAGGFLVRPALLPRLAEAASG